MKERFSKLALITAIPVFLMFALNAQAQWIVRYTSSPNQTIKAMGFYDVNTGYHAGILYNGSTMNIGKTTNGGVNYTLQNSHYTSQVFNSMFVIHPDTVFFCGGHGIILKTVDGGLNWNSYIYSDTTLQLWGMFFLNSQTGYCVGGKGKILKTTNQGLSWDVKPTTFPLTDLHSVFFVNENTGYIGGSANQFLKTTNAGANWENKVGLNISGFESHSSVHFFDANTGMYCTNAGRIVMTTNGGDNWALMTDLSNSGLWCLSFPNAQTGYASASHGIILKQQTAVQTGLLKIPG